MFYKKTCNQRTFSHTGWAVVGQQSTYQHVFGMGGGHDSSTHMWSFESTVKLAVQLFYILVLMTSKSVSTSGAQGIQSSQYIITEI